jgi:hypothetical protein
MHDAAGFEACTRRYGFLYPTRNALRGLSIHHRPDVSRGIQRVTDAKGGDLRAELPDELLKARRLNVYALHRDAALS